jgi:uncharacterized membrane protein (UPF0182 family)
MERYRIESSGYRRRRFGRIFLVATLLVILIGARSFASYLIEYEWWKEMGQTATWFAMLTYQLAPLAAATLLAFVVLWLTHARALKFAGTGLADHPLYSRIASLALLLIAFMVASASIDTWTVVRYMGSSGAEPGAWRDPVFGLPLSFYLFGLPFYSMVRGYVLALVIVCVLLYWIAARGWQLRFRFPEIRNATELDPAIFRLQGGLESRFLRGAAAIFLLALALRFFLARYEMVANDHGFMVGIDYVDEHIGLPLQWMMVFACVAAALLILAGRWLMAAMLAVVLVVQVATPRIVAAVYVRPNEISLERPYIQTHIHATRSAFGLEKRVREVEFKAKPDASIDMAKHKAVLDNVRLWDWHAFQATVSQIQALRPYYVFADADVDRYVIDGQYQQTLLSPRELDLRQLPDARTRWINPHFIYTHGYGLVMADVNRITPDGLPNLLVKDAPPQIDAKGITLTRPEIYYGEVMHEPVFVHTAQQEFNYPSGEKNVFSTYEGKGGIPISSFGMRLAAAIREGDPNILLTGYLTANSRMMIRRKIRDRLEELAAFIQWDGDPYLVVGGSGRMFWMVDGYTVSDSHPYSRNVNVQGMGSVNYIRNSVKATVDAYDGETKLYIFAPDDPIVLAYQRLFPSLFHPASEMPADLRAHARYPETMFRLQAEIYRTYHMLDPQAFYNKEDVWDLARYVSAQNTGPEPVSPTYVVASLPDQDKPEFLLLTPFTPRSKDNLIGLMLARCDGQNLGEIVVLQLSKQELIFGPMQIAARINQDQTISKDLTLWNQQGSQVLRTQTLVLPVGDTFLYIDPIYIQATEARMPQLKKVVLAMGNRLVYADTYEQALAQLASGAPAPPPAISAQPAKPGQPVMPPLPPGPGDRRIESIRNHLRRYRELASQGKWAEAGKELEAIDNEVK